MVGIKSRRNHRVHNWKHSGLTIDQTGTSVHMVWSCWCTATRNQEHKFRQPSRNVTQADVSMWDEIVSLGLTQWPVNIQTLIDSGRQKEA